MTPPHPSIWSRMRGAAALDLATYEDVEHDATATTQAAVVVALTAAAQAIAASSGGLASVAGAAASALVGWLLWAGIAYVVGVRLLGGTSSWGELLRTLGFAQSPNVLAVVGLVPFIGWAVEGALFFWVLAAAVIALRQALDVDTPRAILTAAIGWILFGVLRVVL
jgi:hypothetical protein